MKNILTIAETIAKQLEEMIAGGALKPGERLPSERVLAERLSVSRPSLREGKQILTSKGLLSSRQGGGTYVQDGLNSGLTDPLMDLLKERPEFRYDILEVRHALDSQAAYYAAHRATESDKENIVNAFNDMVKVQKANGDPVASAEADTNFHMSITKASHNMALLHISRSLFSVLQSSIEKNLDKLYSVPKSGTKITDQHKALMDAILAGDANEAKLAAQNHMVYVEESMHDIYKEQERHERFLRHASILSNK
jgi:DNA-binding FadR family transcriptional regulator